MMNPRKFSLALSYALMVAGVSVAFQGVRALLGSEIGQQAAERSFRASLAAGSLDPDGIVPPGTAEALRRRRTLNSDSSVPLPPRPGETVAKLTIPRLGAKLYVIEGIGNKELRRGPGHMPGAAMPGQDGNCIIAGHRDTHFRILRNVRDGDEIVLESEAGVFRYKVYGTQIVPPTNTASLEDTQDAELRLVTCYPFYFAGPAPKRFIVKAALEGEPAAAASKGGS